MELAKRGCSPVLISKHKPADCIEFNKKAVKNLAPIKNRALIITAHWDEQFVVKLQYTLNQLPPEITRIILLGQLPLWVPTLPMLVIRNHPNINGLSSEFSINSTNLKSANAIDLISYDEAHLTRWALPSSPKKLCITY